MKNIVFTTVVVFGVLCLNSLSLAVSPEKENVPAKTELQRLTELVVPYAEPLPRPDDVKSIPELERFSILLDDFVEDYLKNESEEYRQAIRRIALRQALAINPMIDSIESHFENESWSIAGWTDGQIWDYCKGETTATTFSLFTMADDRITGISLELELGSCNGFFNNCCSLPIGPHNLDDAALEDFLIVGRLEDFPITYAHLTDKGLHLLRQYNDLHPVKGLDLSSNAGKKISAKGMENLREMKQLQRLSVDSPDFSTQKAAFELLPYLPNLESFTINIDKFEQTQIDLLGKCPSLQNVTVRSKFPNDIQSLEPLKSLTQLKILRFFSDSPERLTPDTSTTPLTLTGFAELRNLSLYNIKGRTLHIGEMPKLREFYTNASAVEGDLLTENGPKELKRLTYPARNITMEQMRILTQHSFEHLTLYDFESDDPDVWPLLSKIPVQFDCNISFAPSAAEE